MTPNKSSNILILHPDVKVHEQYAHGQSLSLFDSRKFHLLAEEILVPFNHYTDKISSQNRNNLDWWVCSVGTRNPFQSLAFLDVCYLTYLKRLIDSGKKIDHIVVYHKSLETAIKRNFSQHLEDTKITAAIDNKAPFRLLVHLYRLLAFFIDGFKKFIFCYLTKKPKFDQNINLIDVFVFQGSFATGEFHDHYYGDFIEETQENNWIYLSTFDKGAATFQNIKAMRKNSPSFLIKEDYLKFSDYIYAALHAIRFKFRQIPFPKFQGLIIEDILQEDISNNLTRTALYALLNYRFCFRLKEAGTKIKTFWEWYENQNIDKALNKGLHECFNNTKIIGYQGYLPSRFAMNVFPTEEEEKAKLLPHVIALMSQYQSIDIKMYNKNIQTILAPSFRYTYLFRNSLKEKQCAERKTVLIALPMLPQKSLEILHLLSKMNHDQFKDFQFMIKPHPTSIRPINTLIAQQFPKNFQTTTKNFSQLFGQTNVLVSNSSSIVFEAMAFGIPSITIASQTQIDNNVIPTMVDQKIWSLIYDANELQQELLKFLNLEPAQQKELVEISKKVRNLFFIDFNKEEKQHLADVLREEDVAYN